MPRTVARAPQLEARDGTFTRLAAAEKECLECGVVVLDVRLVEQKGEGTGLGTVVGAAGGAIAGHQIERHARTTQHYQVQVRMADGTTRTVKYSARPAWRSGDKVKLMDGKLVSA